MHPLLSTKVQKKTFFPVAETGPEYEAQVVVAKAVCARCPVRTECLTEALARIPHGIAGGLTPAERRALRVATPTDPAVVLEAGLQPGAAAVDVQAAGRVLLTAGRPVAEVAERCGVSTRTAARWLAATRRGGEHGGNRAPLQISQQNDAQAGTRAPEGARG